MKKLIIAVAGWIFYTALMFVFEKDKYDDQSKIFPVKEWWLKNWDNVLLSLLGVCLLCLLSYLGFSLEKEITDKFNSTFGTAYKWNDAFYALGGFGFELLYKAYKNWKNKEK